MFLPDKELYKLEQINIDKAIPGNITDISNIKIDMEKNVPERVMDYIQKVNNPFLVKIGDYIVKIGYSDCPETINDRMKQYITKMIQIKY